MLRMMLFDAVDSSCTDLFASLAKLKRKYLSELSEKHPLLYSSKYIYIFYFKSVLSKFFYQTNQSMSKFTGFHVFWKWLQQLSHLFLKHWLKTVWFLSLNDVIYGNKSEWDLVWWWMHQRDPVRCVSESWPERRSARLEIVQFGRRFLRSFFFTFFFYLNVSTCKVFFFVKGFSIKTFLLCLKRRTREYNLFINHPFVVIISCCVVQKNSPPYHSPSKHFLSVLNFKELN